MSYPTQREVLAAQAKIDAMSGAEQLRACVALCNNMRESFNDEHSAEQLMTLWRAYRLCGWDITPDAWNDAQLLQALSGELVTGFDE